MKENYYEKLLNVNTAKGSSFEIASLHYNIYEPTSYDDLENLFKKYTLSESDSIVDFGCGKGRLNFYINNRFNSKVTGIEMDGALYRQALKNKEAYLSKYDVKVSKIEFENTLAQLYKIKESDNKFYFFNPFSVDVFMRVIDNILGSVYDYKREIDIILFYPSDEFIFVVEEYTLFRKIIEIKLDRFDEDKSERFIVYRMSFNDEGLLKI